MHALHCQAAFSCTSAVLPRMGYALKWSAMRCCRGLYWHVCVCNLWKTKKEAKKFKTCYRLVFVPSFSNKFSCFPPPSPLQAVITVEAGVATALPLHTGKICEGSQEHWKKKKSSRSLCFGCYPRKKKKKMSCWMTWWQCFNVLFFIFFCSCSEDETRRPLIFVGNTQKLNS